MDRIRRAFIGGMRYEGSTPRMPPTRSDSLNGTVRALRMLRDCEASRWRLLSSGDLSAHEPDQTVTIDARSTLDCWTGRQGCRGDCHPAKPRRIKSTTMLSTH